jgi:hypothetical protein
MWDLASRMSLVPWYSYWSMSWYYKLPTRQQSPTGILLEDVGPGLQDKPRILILLLVDVQAYQLPTRQHSPKGILLEDVGPGLQYEPHVFTLLLVDVQAYQLPTGQHSPKAILLEDAGPGL